MSFSSEDALLFIWVLCRSANDLASFILMVILCLQPCSQDRINPQNARDAPPRYLRRQAQSALSYRAFILMFSPHIQSTFPFMISVAFLLQETIRLMKTGTRDARWRSQKLTCQSLSGTGSFLRDDTGRKALGWEGACAELPGLKQAVSSLQLVGMRARLQ